MTAEYNLGRVVSYKFGGLMWKYEKIIIDGINADVRKVNATMTTEALHTYLQRLYSQTMEPSSHRQPLLVQKYPHNFLNLEDGLYTSLVEVLLVALNAASSPVFATYLHRMYVFLLGASEINHFHDVSKLMRELGVTVISCQGNYLINFNAQGRVDYGAKGFETPFQSKYAHDISDAYRRFLTSPSTGPQGSDYLSSVYENIERILDSRDPAQIDGLTVRGNLLRMADAGQDGYSFFTVVSISTPGGGGHANLIRFTWNKERIEMFLFEPHGEVHEEAGEHYGIPQRFLKLMSIHIGVLHKLQCRIDSGFCPQVQGSMGLCAMYSVYFAVLDHFNRNMSPTERKYMLASVCSKSSSIKNRIYKSKKDRRGIKSSDASQYRNSMMTLIDNNEIDETCDLDTMFLMMVAFYGCGRRSLYIDGVVDPMTFNKLPTLRKNSRLMSVASTSRGMTQ